MPSKKVLILGATGRVGSGFLEEYNKHYKRYYDIILGVHQKHKKNIGFKTVNSDILNLNKLKKAMRNIHTVVHLAASPDPKASFKELLEPNIIGCYNVFEAAKKAKCKRVIFASSVHAIKGYFLRNKVGYKVKPTDSTKPITLYGASKVFGESLCHVYSKYLSCIAIRIGAYVSDDQKKIVCFERENYDYVITQRDLAQLIHKCIMVKKLKFAILNGTSDNKRKFMDLKETRKIVGYKPKDDTFEICEGVKMGLKENL